jgi:hypothetical protein
MRNDRGDVIVGYFTKIALVLSVFAVVCFDAVAVGAARVSIEDVARQVAMAGSEAYVSSRNPALAYRAALEAAEAEEVTIEKKSFTVAADGTVTVRVEREATTLLLYRTKKTKGWAVVSATRTAKALPH